MPVPAYKKHLNLPPIDSAKRDSSDRAQASLRKPPAAEASEHFNVFDASPDFRSILNRSPKQRSEHRPARLGCHSPEREPASRSVSPAHRLRPSRPSGRPWNEWEPDQCSGLAPKPLRADPPASMETISIEEKQNPKRLLDFQTRVRVCHRAGRHQAEADAQYNLGLLYEAGHDMGSALAAYKRYLEISLETGPDECKALAYNSIASVYQTEGELNSALYYHHKHAEYADLAGKFVAHTNLGSVYAALGEVSAATQHHQHALRCAIKMESQTSQAIAINNLGMIGGSNGDLYTAKACMERFLELSTDNNNTAATGVAYMHLADIAMTSSDLAQAQLLYTQARHIARLTGNRKAFARASIQIGIAAGQMNFEEYMAKMQERIQCDTT